MDGAPVVPFFHLSALDETSGHLHPIRCGLMDFVQLAEAMSLSAALPTPMSTPVMSCERLDRNIAPTLA